MIRIILFIFYSLVSTKILSKINAEVFFFLITENTVRLVRINFGDILAKKKIAEL